MATLVLEQDEAVMTIENNAVATENDMSSGYDCSTRIINQ